MSVNTQGVIGMVREVASLTENECLLSVSYANGVSLMRLSLPAQVDSKGAGAPAHQALAVQISLQGGRFASATCLFRTSHGPERRAVSLQTACELLRSRVHGTIRATK